MSSLEMMKGGGKEGCVVQNNLCSDKCVLIYFKYLIEDCISITYIVEIIDIKGTIAFLVFTFF